MDFKKFKKKASYFAGWVALHVCTFFVRILPQSWLYNFAGGIASLGYCCAGKQRATALESLKVAFGDDKTDSQIEKVARDCFQYMSKSAIELMFLMDKPALLKTRVRFAQKENLDMALAKGNGVILVSAHFGNFPLLLARLSQEGYNASGIMRPMRDERVEKLFQEKRDRFGVKTIYSVPRNTCVDLTIRQLRANGIVFIPIDQNFGTAGVFVDFFGKQAATATGPVIFAQRTKAAIIPCFIVRQNDDTHVIYFEPPVGLAEGATSEEVITRTIQKLTTVIERYIRTYPAEWGWIHRRWKSKPSQTKGVEHG